MPVAKRVVKSDPGRLQRQRRGIVTRSELLRSARYVFARDGFEHARIEDIAMRARKTRGAFYDNFKDKDDVFLAIFEEDAVRDLSQLAGRLLGLPTLRERIEAVAIYLADLSQDQERMLLNVEFKLYAIRHPQKRKRIADLVRDMRLRTSIPEITRLLPQLAGKTTSTMLTECAAISGIIDGLTLNHLFDPESLDVDALLHYLRICLDDTIPAEQAGT
jgi:AcrR family transcriptional regulator